MADLAQTIAEAKKSAEMGKEDLLKTFSYVPDEKLHWSPGGEARSPIWIVAHCGYSTNAFATFVRDGKMAFEQDPAEASKQIRQGGRDTKTREEAVALVEKSTAEFIAALDTMTPERYASMTPTPFGPLPMAMWVEVTGPHMMGHARQVDYLQTIWGDLEDHMR